MGQEVILGQEGVIELSNNPRDFIWTIYQDSKDVHVMKCQIMQINWHGSWIIYYVVPVLREHRELIPKTVLDIFVDKETCEVFSEKDDVTKYLLSPKFDGCIIHM